MHDIFHIAYYEAKVRFRSWLFWMLAIIAIVGITFFQLGLQGNGVIPHWNMIALPCSMPLVNAYMFNIVQAIVIVFVATDIFWRERQSDSLGSIHVRPFENIHYLTGKFLGVLSVFVFFNVISILISTFINLFASFAPFNLYYYLFYFFTLTLPTLVFLMGLGFLLSGLTSIRFFPKLILLLFVSFALTWAPSVLHGTFDFLGNSLPNVFSDVTGHVSLHFYLLHRLIYFLLGIGFLLLSVHLSCRLPNRERVILKVTRTGQGLITCGFVLVILVESMYFRDEKARDEYRSIFGRNWQMETCRVKEHAIVLRQNGQQLFLKSDLTIYNPNEDTLGQLIFTLNPGLQVQAVRTGNRMLNWQREQQMLFITHPLGGRDSMSLSIEYEGKIDDRFCELSLSESQRLKTDRGDEFFKFGRRNSFVSDEFMLLTPSCAWYPTSISPENPLVPVCSWRDFTRFRLKVVHPRQQVILAPGIPLAKKCKDTVYFTTSKALSGIVMCGGAYKLKQLKLKENNTVFLYYFDGHDIIGKLFPHLTSRDIRSLIYSESETLLSRGIGGYPETAKLAKENADKTMFLLSDISLDSVMAGRGWYEPRLRRLTCVEIPLAFNPEWQTWKWGSEYVQPGMVLLPELGVGTSITYRSPGVRKRVGLSDEEIERNDLHHVFNNFFLPYRETPAMNPFLRLIVKSSGEGEDRVRSSSNPYYFYPLLVDPEVFLYSAEYPFVDAAFKMLWREKRELLCSIWYDKKSSVKKSSVRSPVPMDGMRNKSSARAYLQNRTIEEVLGNRNISEEIVREILFVKNEDLLNRLTVNVSRQLFFYFLGDFYSRYRGEMAFDVFVDEMQDKLDIDVKKVVREWYTSRHNAYFRIKDVTSNCYKDHSGFLHFKIWNDSRVPGVITVRLACGIDRYIPFRLEVGEAKKIKITDQEFSRYKTCSIDFGNCSLLPSEYCYRVIHREGEPGLHTGIVESDADVTEFSKPANEYVADNGDSGFKLIEPRVTLLQYLWEDSKIEGNRWVKSLSSRSYGDFVRSYHSKKGGDGQTKVQWSIDLPEPGRYEVWAFVYYNQCYFRRGMQNGALAISPGWIKNSLKFHYTILHGGQKTAVEVETITCQEEISKNEFLVKKILQEGKQYIPAMDGYFYTGWESLGVYDFPKGKAAVILDDRGEPDDTIIADAVKWVKVIE